MADVSIRVDTITAAALGKLKSFSSGSVSAFTRLGRSGRTAMKRLGGGVSGLLTKLTSLRGILIAVASGAALGKFISLSNKQEEAEIKLKTALGHTSQALLDQASALQKVTTFGDEEIIQAQALIGAFTRDEASIQRATKATLDLAAAKGMDLATAADLVSKTLGSSTNALSRYGIEVTGSVGSTERLNSLVEGLTQAFGGQAAALAATNSGGLKQFRNALGDVGEKLGDLIKAILGPLARDATPLILAFADKLKNLINADDFQAKVRVVVDKIEAVAKGFLGAANFIAATTSNLIGFVSSLITLSDKIISAFFVVIDEIKALPGEALQAGKDTLSSFVTGITSGIEGAVRTVKDALSGLIGATGTMPDVVIPIKGEGSAILPISEKINDIKTMFGSISEVRPSVTADFSAVTAGINTAKAEMDFLSFSKNPFVVSEVSRRLPSGGNSFDIARELFRNFNQGAGGGGGGVTRMDVTVNINGSKSPHETALETRDELLRLNERV